MNIFGRGFVFCLIVGVVPALAEEPHWKDGKQPVCQTVRPVSAAQTIRGSCSAGEAVVGYRELTFGVEATAEGVAICRDKGNKDFFVPGAYPAKAKFSQLVTVPASDTRNGTYRFPSVPPVFILRLPTAEEAGCPNDKDYTVTLETVKWTAKYVVYQPYPNLIQGLSLTLSEPEFPKPPARPQQPTKQEGVR